MDKSTAQKIVKETLQDRFDKTKFINLVKNLLNKIDESKAFQCNTQYVKEIYRDYVKSYERIATYTDPNDKKIDILIVHLQKETSLERARTAQRNFAAKYLKGRAEKDAGLIAFVSPNLDDWRFSFVKMEYKFIEDPGGKTKVKEEFTPAKRYSFLVGKYENSYTAQSRIAPVLIELKSNPLLRDIEDIFSVEKVTKEFFEEYRKLFVELKDELDKIVKNNHKIKTDFDDKCIETADFAKKLLGQIVFLYFLQKKGWFGVGRDMDWGTGPKDFLRKLFAKQVVDYKNFFNDILEPLFYEALATIRPDDFYSRFDCKIPFLNGGLFDPIQDYDWIHTDIVIPDSLFSNDKTTKQGDNGTGILDVFDRYNFTVKEDEPLEKEVAVDPEMLGKVFENLLEVKDRKSKGTYYTPREIVHYMCEQSLLNYLKTETSLDEGKIYKLITSDFMINPKLGDIKKQIKDKVLTLSVDEVQKIDNALKMIKVCDPACGSGAFLVAMMQLLVSIRIKLGGYFDLFNIKREEKSLFDLKEASIRDNIYGVDIDPSAVDIAKLRLWLSLIVDEEDIKQINPLPNLDYKIMQGNSLLEEFEEIKLFDEKLFMPSAPSFDMQKRIDDLKATQSELQKQYIKSHSAGKLTKEKGAAIEAEIKKISTQLKQLAEQPKAKEEPSLFASLSEARKKADELKLLHKEYFDASHKDEKEKLGKLIDNLEWDLIEATLREQGKGQSLKKVEQFKKTNVRPFFIWGLHFADVFQGKGGFDVVIANPPYINIEKINENNRKVYLKIYGEDGKLGKRYDIYQLFLMKGISLLSKEGALSYILPNTFLMGSSYLILRRYICQSTSIHSLVDLPQGVFNATVDNVLLFLRRTKISGNRIHVAKLNVDSDISNLSLGNWDDSFAILQEDLNEQTGFKLNVHMNPRLQSLFRKIEKDNKPLGEITESSQGIIIYKTKKDAEMDKYTSFIKKRGWKKLLRGTNIGYYCIKWRGEYLHYGDWLWCKRENKYFNNPKILLQAMRNKALKRRLVAAFDDEAFYNAHNLGNIIANPLSGYDLKYILAILNSALINFWYRNHFPNVNINPGDFRQIPIRKALNQNVYVDIVNRIIDITKLPSYLDNSAQQDEVRLYIKRLDQMVYKLYGLTYDEVKIVDPAFEMTKEEYEKYLHS